MHIITLYVDPDERAEAYFTGPKSMPGFAEDDNPRMIEQVFVYRDDAIAKYERDLGPASDYLYVPPLFMPSFGEETVASLQWHGERHRNDPKWERRIKEYKESSTLFKDVLRAEEQKILLRQNRSQFGPSGSFQRNGYPREYAVRQFMDRRAAITKKVQK